MDHSKNLRTENAELTDFYVNRDDQKQIDCKIHI